MESKEYRDEPCVKATGQIGGRIDVERKERVRVGRRLTAMAICAAWHQYLQST